MAKRQQKHPFRLQSRDVAVLTELFHAEFATRKHLALCCFGGSYEAAKKRIIILIRMGLVSNKRGSPLGAEILRLTRKGESLVRKDQKIVDPNSSRSPKILSPGIVRDHEIGIRDIRATFKSTLRHQPGLVLLEFQVSRSMTAFSVECDLHRKPETVRPDAFMVIKDDSGKEADQCFFLELDRSTESQSHLSHLANLYMSYFRNGHFARKRGKSPFDRVRDPMRVLIIFESAVRLANTAEKLLKETNIKTLVWLATKEDVMTDPLGPIWLCPLDLSGGSENARKRSLFQKQEI